MKNITPKEASFLRTCLKTLEGQSGLVISDNLYEMTEKLKNIAEADAQTLARWKASEELEHAAIAYGEAVHADSDRVLIDQEGQALEDIAINYHAACCDTGGE